KRKENVTQKRIDTQLFNICPECRSDLAASDACLKISTDWMLQKGRHTPSGKGYCLRQLDLISV
ncbi:MAG: hypothetical protein ABH851_06325, partial [Methanobacteriota archaeon]